MDVANGIAVLINEAFTGAPGSKITIAQPDAAAFGATRAATSYVVTPGNMYLATLMYRLDLGRVSVDIDCDEADITAPQDLLGNDYYAAAAATVPQIAFSVSGNVITLSGSIQSGDVIGVQQGINGAGYEIQPANALAGVASGLSLAMTAAGIPATAAATAITLTGGGTAFEVNVGAKQTLQRKIWRRRKRFFATFYGTTVYDRSFYGKLLQTAIEPGTRMAMPDGTAATVFGNMTSLDYGMQQKDTTLIRRVLWNVDYIATKSIQGTPIVAIPLTVTPTLGVITVAPIAHNEL